MTIQQIIQQLTAIIFKYNDSDKISFGYKAQDVEKILPKEAYSIVQEDKDGYLLIDYSQIIPLITEYLKYLENEVVQLKTEIAELKKPKHRGRKPKTNEKL